MVLRNTFLPGSRGALASHTGRLRVENYPGLVVASRSSLLAICISKVSNKSIGIQEQLTFAFPFVGSDSN